MVIPIERGRGGKEGEETASPDSSADQERKEEKKCPRKGAHGIAFLFWGKRRLGIGVFLARRREFW